MARALGQNDTEVTVSCTVTSNYEKQVSNISVIGWEKKITRPDSANPFELI